MKPGLVITKTDSLPYGFTQYYGLVGNSFDFKYMFIKNAERALCAFSGLNKRITCYFHIFIYLYLFFFIIFDPH